MKSELPQERLARAVDLHRAGRLAEAASIYHELRAEKGPCAPDAAVNLGVILDDEERHGEAVELYQEALRLRGEEPLALNNMGNSLLRLGRFEEAAFSFRRALLHAPASLEARLGLGAALQREGDAAGAIACFRECLEQDPGSAEAHWNLSLALLISGEFREGWAEYQWRWRKESFTSPRRGFEKPVWDGSPLHGRTILVHCEQGLGDTIQFARYLPMVHAAGGEVLVECQAPSLRPLLQGIAGVSAVYAMGERLPHFDVQVPLLSLPRVFDTTLDNLPDQVPYLGPAPGRVENWSTRVRGGDELRVGVVWAGKRTPDPFRSCRLEDLAPLGSIPGVSLYSLQMGERSGDAARADVPDLVDLTADIADFGDTAALVSLLDLVVSVDTSVAHLAGALGKPVWLLLPKAGDYRWLLEREDSPWYPSMRIFRQDEQGEWGAVLERVSRELLEKSCSFLERSASAAPFDGRRVFLCAASLAAQGRHREAAVRFSKASNLLPGRWEPHYSMAQSLQVIGLLAQARQSLETALSLGGEPALLHEALGIVTQMEGDLEAAVQHYARALAIDPLLLKARFNLATARRQQGEYAEAMAGFREVIRQAPEQGDARWNLATLLLLTGDFCAGWREFPWRFKKSAPAPVRRWQDHPTWDGSLLHGKTILLHCEEGLGDTLQFIRYAALVAERGGRVIAEVPAPLAGMAARAAGVRGVVVAGNAPPDFDVQASLLELPAIFGTGPDTVPAAVPYLQLDPELAPKMEGLVPRDGSLRVGVVWGGNPSHNNDARRSMALEKLAPLAELPGVTLYSLQVDRKEGETAALSVLGVTDLSHAIRDFSDSGALAAELDLVLTVDTSMAHLCGGLALPVWVMLPFVPDWRWLLKREDSPWYPTMRLFRQETAGDWDGVVARVRDALAEETLLRKGDAHRHKNRGRVLSEQGRFLEAAREFELALPVRPVDVELLNDLGCALDNGGKHAEAVEAYRKALAVDPCFMAAHYNMGNSLKNLGRSGEAVECYRRALQLRPALPQGWHNLGLSLQDLGRLDEAREALERAVQLNPDYLEARHNLGELHQGGGDLDAALRCFREVLARDPRHIPSWNALGIALQQQERLDEAVECYRKALSIDPGYLHALNNLGAASKGLGMLDAAEQCYRRVISLDRNYVDAHWNLALVQLLRGDYQEGWRGYEWRFQKADPVRRRGLPQPLWDGSSLQGKTILLHAEQGFGDAIQFVRYATLLAAAGAVVLVECQTRAIAPVVATVPGVAGVLVRGDGLPRFDVHAPLMSLPGLCGTTLATVPAQVPYLFAEELLVEKWRERVAGAGVKVGLVWAGRKSYKDDHRRSLTLQAFAPLARVPGARFYSLQVGPGAQLAASPPPGMELTHLGGEIGTFADTAAIIANLDLVISADTAVAHLAGALGKAVWVLLPMICDWRWLLDRDDSPWYPTARLFRQRRRGEWGGVLERVAEELAKVAGEASAVVSGKEGVWMHIRK